MIVFSKHMLVAHWLTRRPCIKGQDYAKCSNPRFQKKKRTPEHCGRTAYVDPREHLIDRTSEAVKKSSLDALLLGKGSSKDFMVEMGGVEPPSESVLTGTSPGADGYLHSLVRARAVTLRDLVASSCMAGAKLCRRTFTTDRRPIPGRGTPGWNAR